MNRTRPTAVNVTVLILLGSAFGVVGWAEPPPSILLVTVDTLRADHLSCYGYERPTSPRLDRFAAALFV